MFLGKIKNRFMSQLKLFGRIRVECVHFGVDDASFNFLFYVQDQLLGQLCNNKFKVVYSFGYVTELKLIQYPMSGNFGLLVLLLITLRPKIDLLLEENLHYRSEFRPSQANNGKVVPNSVENDPKTEYPTSEILFTNNSNFEIP